MSFNSPAMKPLKRAGESSIAALSQRNQTSKKEKYLKLPVGIHYIRLVPRSAFEPTEDCFHSRLGTYPLPGFTKFNIKVKCINDGYHGSCPGCDAYFNIQRPAYGNKVPIEKTIEQTATFTAMAIRVIPVMNGIRIDSFKFASEGIQEMSYYQKKRDGQWTCEAWDNLVKLIEQASASGHDAFDAEKGGIIQITVSEEPTKTGSKPKKIYTHKFLTDGDAIMELPLPKDWEKDMASMRNPSDSIYKLDKGQFQELVGLWEELCDIDASRASEAAKNEARLLIAQRFSLINAPQIQELMKVSDKVVEAKAKKAKDDDRQEDSPAANADRRLPQPQKQQPSAQQNTSDETEDNETSEGETEPPSRPAPSVKTAPVSASAPAPSTSPAAGGSPSSGDGDPLARIRARKAERDAERARLAAQEAETAAQKAELRESEEGEKNNDDCNDDGE